MSWGLLALERLDDGLAAARRLAAAARRAGNGPAAVAHDVAVTLALGLLGRIAEAADLADATEQAARVTGNDQAVQWALWMRAWVLIDRGDLDAALAAARRASSAASASTTRPCRSSRARCSAPCSPPAATTPADGSCWPATTSTPAGSAAGPRRWWRPTSPGDLAAAAAHAARAAALAARVGLAGARTTAGRAQALVALADGDPARRPGSPSRRPRRARGRLRPRRGARPPGGRAGARRRRPRGRAARAAGRRGRRGGVRRPAGARRGAARAARPGPPRRPRRRPAPGEQGLASLTGREREIAEHVAAGLTNREIGERLYLSEKTIETHLSRVFSKLGVRSRAEVAARVAAEGAPGPAEGSYPGGVRALPAFAIDAVLIVGFAALGRRSHDEGSSLAGILEVAAPFLIAMAVGWLVARAWRSPLAPRPRS